jgi:hypothetical protein
MAGVERWDGEEDEFEDRRSEKFERRGAGANAKKSKAGVT